MTKFKRRLPVVLFLGTNVLLNLYSYRPVVINNVLFPQKNSNPLANIPETNFSSSSVRQNVEQLQELKHVAVSSNSQYALFVQMGINFHLLDEIMTCATNYAQAIPEGETLDIHLALLEKDKDKKDDVLKQFQNQLLSGQKNSIRRTKLNVNVIVTENAGADMGQFLTQIRNVANNDYKFFLKVHAKTHQQWRRRMFESLCGSPNQVTSILMALEKKQNIQMIAPLGTAFGPTTPIDKIYPTIKEIYNMKSTAAVFDPWTVGKMNELYHSLTQQPSQQQQQQRVATEDNNPTTLPKQRIVAGSSFWMKWSALKASSWAREYDRIHSELTRGYKENQGMEHVMERLIPSMIPGDIAEITPAPRVFALYFPQFHPIPENDRFWGANFTEWTLLKPLVNMTPPIRKPLLESDGGLGYYNLLDYRTRQRQAELAKQYGVTGFCYYHYWFSGSEAPEDHVVMPGVLDAMLKDGEPNLPFMLSWANEPWTRRWSGTSESNSTVLLSQDYGDKEEWEEHFMYLLRFFQHPNYERVNGMPAFAIYRPGHLGDKMVPMIQLWQQLAKDHGFSGIHIIQTVGNFYKTDETHKVVQHNNGAAIVDASFQFWPLLFASFPQLKYSGYPASTHDVILNIPDRSNRHIQYWGSHTSFDRRPRDYNAKPDFLVQPSKFDEGLQLSFAAMSAYSNRRIDSNLFFVTAWNEWNEQALLEPDDMYSFGFLEALQKNLRNVPVQIIKHY